MSKKEELEALGYKTYENDKMAVFWNPTICQHAGICVKGNNLVFDVSRMPWIDLSKASAIERAKVKDFIYGGIGDDGSCKRFESYFMK